MNRGYVSSESTAKVQSNDGLPTYEEAVAGIKNPIVPVPSVAPTLPTAAVINEENENISSSRGQHRRHRHRRHRHQHHNLEHSNDNSQPDTSEEHSRRRHRRGFRLKRHLAKINRRNRPETD